MEYVFVRLEDLVRIKRLITCFTQQNKGDYCSKTESHDFWEMVYVRSGRLIYRNGDTRGELSAGDVIFHEPNVPHGLEGNGEDPFSFFIVTFECDSPAMQALEGRIVTLPAKLIKVVDLIIEEKNVSFSDAIHPLVALDHALLGSQQMLGLYLEQLLIGILRECAKDSDTVLYASREEKESRLAADVCAYLEAHLYENVDMQTLCEYFHYGKSRLSEVFRRTYGDSVMHWYLTRRIEAAGRAILCGEGSIAEISARLQFDSPQYFSRVFKKIMGVSPREYRSTVQ